MMVNSDEGGNRRKKRKETVLCITCTCSQFTCLLHSLLCSATPRKKKTGIWIAFSKMRLPASESKSSQAQNS